MILMIIINNLDHNSLKSILHSFIITHGEKELINCIERDLNSFKNLKDINSASYNESSDFRSIVSMLIKWLNQLIATLDCYTSLFKENCIDVKLLMKNSDSR